MQPTFAANSAFWKTTPRKSIIVFLLGVFIIFTIVGFADDVMHMGRHPLLVYVFSLWLPGAFAVFYAVSGIVLRNRFWKLFIPVFVVQIAVMNFLAHLFPDLPQPKLMGAPEIARLHTRLFADGVATVVAMALSYACFLYVSMAEARRYARVHTEMLLAAEIHRVLVPTIDARIDGFEFYGRSAPSGEVGGDLIDVFQHGRSWIAYVADVSGHGVAPGVVMAMVKSAARMQLSSNEPTAELLARLNAVLLPIKKPEMFVTMGYLAWDGERLAYSLAGHPPILHYCAATEKITEVTECSNVPVGMFPRQQFVSGSLECGPRDLLLLYTDGLMEVANRKDEEFGLDRIKAVLSAQADNSLGTALQAFLDATDLHGSATDDRSLLLVRCGSIPAV